MVMDHEGRLQKDFEHNSQGNSLFTAIWKLTSTNNNNIFVADFVFHRSGKAVGRVAVLDQRGTIINIYTGNDDSKSFQPYDITMTPSDRVIVCDPINNSIQILTNPGHLLDHISLTVVLG